MATDSSQTMSLDDTLARIADRIATHGTHSESVALEQIAIAALGACPGTAAALVDWSGPEITRLRAFGIVHCALLRAAASFEEIGLATAPDSTPERRVA